jgi:hypothetical protein
VRLELPAEVLAACRPDLSDLRVFDAAGREVPFVSRAARRAPPRPAAAGSKRSRSLRPRSSTRGARPAERERAPSVRRESYVIAAPPAPPAGTAWDLALAIGAADFASRVEVRAAEGAAAAPPFATGTLFRLSKLGMGGRAAEKLRLPLAATPSSPVLVTLETEGWRFLEPSFRYEARRRLEGAGELEVPLEIRSTTTDGGANVVVLERPVGLLPSRLRLASSTAFFDRPVEVWDDGAGARDQPSGRARLFRSRRRRRWRSSRWRSPPRAATRCAS